MMDAMVTWAFTFYTFDYKDNFTVVYFKSYRKYTVTQHEAFCDEGSFPSLSAVCLSGFLGQMCESTELGGFQYILKSFAATRDVLFSVVSNVWISYSSQPLICPCLFTPPQTATGNEVFPSLGCCYKGRLFPGYR